MAKNNEIKISVRNLIEFVLRSGDLDTRFMGSSRAVEGTKAHGKVQKSYGENYTPEVTLRYSIPYQDLLLTVEGRADGILQEENRVIIDEIKSTTQPLDVIDENYNHLHWGQAKCYAYIYGQEQGLDEVDVQLTYYQLDTEEIKYLRKTFLLHELKQFFDDLIAQYFSWATFTHDWQIKRDTSIHALSFPFEAYRKGQREFAKAVYRTVVDGKKLFAQAPTGIGKTISTLFPTIKAIGEGHTSKIFYLTAKTITRQVAEEAFYKMHGRGLLFKSVTLTAKDKICFQEESICNPEHCEYARGHFDRVNEALRAILHQEQLLTREKIEAYAKEYHICPFEFSLDLTLWADAVVCDYNYAFDPRVYLKRFFSEEGGDYTFLVDEAHNLVDRSREMFSAELYKRPFLDLKRVFQSKAPSIAKALNQLNKNMLVYKKYLEEENQPIHKDNPKDLYPPLHKFMKEAEEWLTKNENQEGYEELLELYFSCHAFLRIAEFYDERYVTYVEKVQKDIKVKLFCLDPSYLLRDALRRGRSAILFSATLTPLPYFREILGGNEEDKLLRLPSPFDRNNLCLSIANRISTKYRAREDSYEAIVDYIHLTAQQRKGNYFAFFPSYQYMDQVYQRFIEKYPEIKTLLQGSSMVEAEREQFLLQFQSNSIESLVGFAVLGGIFSEGIDLVGDRLVGAIIVGVGLPQICLERDIIMNYFQEKNHLGYEYAYMYPGMNKVLQGAGRVIRSEWDQGVVLLIDERFRHSRYQKLFPQEWSNPSFVRDLKELDLTLESFWNPNK
ncbi:Rad3-related DNA helicase [Anaerosolibacter carboniphilus]|uniref:Rad3-related DNA helicase n=1 Tax=Anaerosolibacter carboniphilus TaxID=1417629 RepID=A0A841L021_9FIRM|nr:ATP-dependent DNA helicase [Anaerosolibacter carboniphilus]MBB6218903.1 Rad3-related DNA helicase [Anaerosolibacter carboniphilus]